MLGVVGLNEALRIAQDRGLDLVEVSPNAEPPVCKILDFGKFKYEAQKKAHEAKKKQKVIEIKELKIRPNIGPGDYTVKLKSIKSFIEDGNKVKITLKFRGREITHDEIGMQLMQRIMADTAEYAKAEQEPKMDGKQIMMVLIPA